MRRTEEEKESEKSPTEADKGASPRLTGTGMSPKLIVDGKDSLREAPAGIIGAGPAENPKQLCLVKGCDGNTNEEDVEGQRRRRRIRGLVDRVMPMLQDEPSRNTPLGVGALLTADTILLKRCFTEKSTGEKTHHRLSSQ